MFVVAVIVLLFAALPAFMFWRNASLFLPATAEPALLASARQVGVSVLIPARNEEASIGPALESILQSDHSNFEVIVMDDASEDRTVPIVEGTAAQDPRVVLAHSQGLPDGWNGKQNACWQLAQRARFDRFLFLDADVRLSPDALSRIVAESMVRQAPLVSGFPHQETGTWSERLLIPLMHYVLLGFLPIDQMRAGPKPEFAAGCGQLFLAERTAYMAVGGHSAIASSRHDGIQLPKAFRRGGFPTDIFDATDVARCRMYHNLPQVVRGLLKNATEGIANPRLIVPFTVLLVAGAVLPVVLLVVGWLTGSGPVTMGILALACILAWLPRGWAAVRFSQSWFGVVLHPVSVAWFVALQWTALLLKSLNVQTLWRGRQG